MPPTIPSEEEVLGYFESCSNWGRWGDDDERGAVNHITPETRKTRRGAGCVKASPSAAAVRSPRLWSPTSPTRSSIS